MRIQYLLTINILLKTLSFVNEAAVGVIVLAGTFRNIAKGTTDPRVEVCLSKYLLSVISIFPEVRSPDYKLLLFIIGSRNTVDREV